MGRRAPAQRLSLDRHNRVPLNYDTTPVDEYMFTCLFTTSLDHQFTKVVTFFRFGRSRPPPCRYN